MSKASASGKKAFTAQARAFERIDLNLELKKLENQLSELKTLYEQHFMGIVDRPPSAQHKRVTDLVRRLLNAPFKNSATRYRLRMLNQRYQSLNTYWKRVMKQREEGNYFRDVFKAEIREQAALEEARSQTEVGKVSNSVKGLFNSYKDALEKQTGRKQEIDFNAFQKNLINRAKDFKKQHGVKKVSFKIKVKDGKVVVQAKGSRTAAAK